MTLGATVFAKSVQSSAGPIYPASLMTDWQVINDDPLTADNAGSVVITPGGISRAAQHLFNVGGMGTTVQIRLRYPVGVTPSTQVIVQPFGLDSNGVPQRLTDASGAHALTLTVDTTNDPRDATGTYAFTQPVEVDAQANKQVLIAVKTALAGGSLSSANCALMARQK